ncbi:MAG: hypothetical protein NT062_17865 [Proteobacteria bacterium]|nr:hypothetical protein [Pseudomonadota bacterium]
MSMLTRATAAIDRGVVRLMERRMAARTPRLDRGDPRGRLIELAAAYSDGTLGTPSPFFPAPPRPEITTTSVGEGPLGTRVLDLAWPSDYRPFLPAARELYATTTVNQTAHARHWTSRDGRPTIVLIHGWAGGNPTVASVTFNVAYWLKHGFDVAAFVLPYHGARAPGASGALFPSPNPLRTNEGFGQAIFDLRALAIHLRATTATAIGALGMSLGGYTTALWATIEPLDFAIAMIPAVSFSRLMWSHGESSPARKHAVRAGISEDLLEEAFAVHAPVTRPPLVAREARAVIAGRGDRITPADHARELAAHWGVDIDWFDGGHLAQLGRGEAVRDVRRRLGALALPGQRYRE